jgi:hypothetical protein
VSNNVVGVTIEIGYKLRIQRPAENLNPPPMVAEEYIGVLRPVEPIHAHIGDKVIWTIINYTKLKRKVAVDKFSPSEPVSFIDGKSKQVGPNGGSKQIKSNVKDDAKKRPYTYRVYIEDELAVDPELDIES